jgi:hypothetical protein
VVSTEIRVRRTALSDLSIALPKKGCEVSTERKTLMISARLPAALVTRVDFVARNTDAEAVKNRSTAVLAAIEAWLPVQERRLEDLGILPKKNR